MEDPTTVGELVRAVWRVLMSYDAVTSSTVAIAFFAAATWWTTRRQLRAQKEALALTHRPFIAVSGIRIVQPNPARRRADYEITIRNFGHAPAIGFTCSQSASIGDRSMPFIQLAEPQEDVISPGLSVAIQGRIEGDDFEAVMADTVQWRIKVTASYRGPTGAKHGYQQEYLYVPRDRRFAPVANVVST